MTNKLLYNIYCFIIHIPAFNLNDTLCSTLHCPVAAQQVSWKNSREKPVAPVWRLVVTVVSFRVSLSVASVVPTSSPSSKLTRNLNGAL